MRLNAYRIDLAPAGFRFREQLRVQHVAPTAGARKNAYGGDERCRKVVVFTRYHEHRTCADAGRMRGGGHRHQKPATRAQSCQPRWRQVRDATIHKDCIRFAGWQVAAVCRHHRRLPPRAQICRCASRKITVDFVRDDAPEGPTSSARIAV
jgi:hypothetical protein